MERNVPKHDCQHGYLSSKRSTTISIERYLFQPRRRVWIQVYLSYLISKSYSPFRLSCFKDSYNATLLNHVLQFASLEDSYRYTNRKNSTDATDSPWTSLAMRVYSHLLGSQVTHFNPLPTSSNAYSIPASSTTLCILRSHLQTMNRSVSGNVTIIQWKEPKTPSVVSHSAAHTGICFGDVNLDLKGNARVRE